jgi:DNA repair protein RecN (Recombination protein N)
MIKSLSVSNFALIDDLDISFHPGLTALTGETGAGKSIILESLFLLFGKRSDAQMIRHGHEQAQVKGVFILSDDLSIRFDLPKEIEVMRSIDQNGRHVIRLNNEVITLMKLKEIMSLLGGIHSQNETMMLYDKNAYLDFIDQIDMRRTTELLNVYLIERSHYYDAQKNYDNMRTKKHQSLEKQEFLEFQVKEISQLNLKKGELQEINDQIEKLKNYDKIVSNLKEAYEKVSQESSGIDLIYDAAKALEKIRHLDPVYEGQKARLENAYYELDDVKSILYDHLASLDFDQDAFNHLQERSYELSRIEQKYKKTTDELITYLEEIKDELHMITDYDDYLSALLMKVEHAKKVCFASGIKLHELRLKHAKTLEKQVLNELKDLDLDKAQFEIIFDEIDASQPHFLESGLDSVEFMISLNEGEPIKPLSRVASGGERARFMFALKSIHAKKENLSLLILDEIDIGISGKTAAKVAQKMQMLSTQMQLIVITHLPQVAAKANHHYGITKQKENDRMVTRIKDLDDEARIIMIATMLSDEKLSHFAIEQAKLLLSK